LQQLLQHRLKGRLTEGSNKTALRRRGLPRELGKNGEREKGGFAAAAAVAVRRRAAAGGGGGSFFFFFFGGGGGFFGDGEMGPINSAAAEEEEGDATDTIEETRFPLFKDAADIKNARNATSVKIV